MTYLRGEPHHILLNGTIGLAIEINMFQSQICMWVTSDPTMLTMQIISYRANIRALRMTLKTINSVSHGGRASFIGYLSNDRIRYFDRIIHPPVAKK